MNNFVFSQDPLLYQSAFPRQFDESPAQLKQQMDETFMKYKAMQEQYKNMPESAVEDKVKALDDLLSDITGDNIAKLNNNEEYLSLHNSLQNLIQKELLDTIKWKINNNPKAQKNMDRQIEIIKNVKKESEAEERKNLNELNDYMKNYSSITFDEYKRIKSGIATENKEDNKKSNKK